MKLAVTPSLSWLEDPGVFKVNRLEAHSDHRYYAGMAKAEAGAPMDMRYSLNGSWKFSYAPNPASRVEPFLRNPIIAPHGTASRFPDISSCRASAGHNMSIRCIRGMD